MKLFLRLAKIKSSHQDVIMKRNLGSSTKLNFKAPLSIHSGNMQWLFDMDNKKYLDMFGGIVPVSVGHSHPKINAALKNQLDLPGNSTSIYLHPKIHEYSEKLQSKMPEYLKAIYFVNFESEAIDLAILLARIHTKNLDVLAFNNAYHGRLSTRSSYGFSIDSVNSGIQLVRATHNRNYSSTVFQERQNHYQDCVNILKNSVNVGKYAAIFGESLQGVGNTFQLSNDYLKKSVASIRDSGGIFISNEIETGFGRTGYDFWGFSSHNIMPDIVIMAEGIGNGFPLAAAVTTTEIAQSLTQPSHFNVHGGNPLASAVGIAVLEVIEEEALQENSLIIGDYLLEGLARLHSLYGIIGKVMGQGLLIVVELVTVTGQPINKELFHSILEHCKDLGVLFGQCGFNGNVLRIKPPMCITHHDVDFALDVLEKAIKAHAGKNNAKDLLSHSL